jgi:hypothetical protein
MSLSFGAGIVFYAAAKMAEEGAAMVQYLLVLPASVSLYILICGKLCFYERRYNGICNS